MKRFEGKKAIVTGDNSEIGYAATCMSVSEGAQVMITGADFVIDGGTGINTITGRVS